MNPRRSDPRRGAAPATLVQDETLTDLANLDVVDLDLTGALHLNRTFADDVQREHRAEQKHREALGYQHASNVAPVLRGALRARARANGREDVDVERLVHAILRLFPQAWDA